MTEFFENGKIENQIADSDSHAWSATFRLKDPEGKILNWEIGIGWNVDETTQRRTHQLDLTTKHKKATKKIQNHSKELRDLRALRGGSEKSQRAQIVARFVEAATAERRDELAAILQAFDADLPFAPREKIFGK